MATHIQELEEESIVFDLGLTANASFEDCEAAIKGSEGVLPVQSIAQCLHENAVAKKMPPKWVELLAQIKDSPQALLFFPESFKRFFAGVVGVAVFGLNRAPNIRVDVLADVVALLDTMLEHTRMFPYIVEDELTDDIADGCCHSEILHFIEAFMDAMDKIQGITMSPYMKDVTDKISDWVFHKLDRYVQ